MCRFNIYITIHNSYYVIEIDNYVILNTLQDFQFCEHVIFCGRVPWLYQCWPGGFMLFVVLCPGTPEGSTGSGSGFKASQKTRQRLKVSSSWTQSMPNPILVNIFKINIILIIQYLNLC